MLYLLLFVTVALLNVLPAFAPPTWVVLAFFVFNFGKNFLLVAVIGALAAVLGRALLALSAEMILRREFLSRRSRGNIDVLAAYLKERPGLTAGGFFIYAFWAYTASEVSGRLAADLFHSGRFLTGSFIISQIVGIMLLVLFVKLDWRALLYHRQLQLTGRRTIEDFVKQKEVIKK